MSKQVWRIVLTVSLFCGVAALADSLLKVSVEDQSSQPAAAVAVQIMRGTDVVASSDTDETGAAAFPRLAPGHYSVIATKQGFEPARSEFDVGESGSSAIELTLVPTLARHEQIEVHDTVTPIEEGAAPPSTVTPQLARELPQRPSTVTDVLPLVQGVLRATTGGLQISGAGEHRGALIVNSADVTDPATGQFGLTAPVDVVENLWRGARARPCNQLTEILL